MGLARVSEAGEAGGAVDNLCQKLMGADEKYREALEHLEKLYQNNASEKEKETAWVWLRSAQIDRDYLQKSFERDVNNWDFLQGVKRSR